MSEQRRKTHSLLLRLGGKTRSLELFDSRLWPEKNGEEGLYRVRLDDAWHCPAGKYSFLTPAAVGELVASLLSGSPAWEEARPRLRIRDEVRASLDEPPLVCRGILKTAPYQKRDGRWYAQVYLVCRGTREMLCADLAPARRR